MSTSRAKLVFCTGNAGKFATAQEHLAPFGIEIEQAPLELDEIQSTSVEVVARHQGAKSLPGLRTPPFSSKSRASTLTASTAGPDRWSSRPWTPSGLADLRTWLT